MHCHKRELAQQISLIDGVKHLHSCKRSSSPSLLYGNTSIYLQIIRLVHHVKLVRGGIGFTFSI